MCLPNGTVPWSHRFAPGLPHTLLRTSGLPIILDMRKHRRSAKKDHKQLLDLIHKGQLFALQDWIEAGKPLNPPDTSARPPRVLCAAVRTGFHSMVEELLRASRWSPREMADALDWARAHRRYDIADLLLNHGAEPEEQDFQTVCELLDLAMMERHLRAGTDPNQDNVFARALCSAKARPLLGFYRQLRAEFPALDDQAALALTEAVKNNQVRWTALLVWAGADPLRPVPHDMESTFPVDPEDSTTAAEEAIWRSNPEIIKLLHLKPSPPQAVALLSEAGFHGNEELFRTLLMPLSADQLNTTPRASCAPLERLVNHSGYRWLADSRLFNSTKPWAAGGRSRTPSGLAPARIFRPPGLSPAKCNNGLWTFGPLALLARTCAPGTETGLRRSEEKTRK